MAILLAEEGMKKRCQMYATDMNEMVLGQARKGIYPIKAARAYSEKYQKAGGRYSFSDYYTTD
ncbi:unnamed protein product, partial [Cyprideis torosa]